MIEEQNHIKELYELNHRHDFNSDKRFDYENNLYKKSLSHYIFGNDITNDFLTKLEKMSVWMFESTLVIRNFWNYTVPRYYNNHRN
jgi:hypothetical protein